MDWALIMGAAVLGLAGIPHCAAMCGPTCAALVCGMSPEGLRLRSIGFLATRALGYAVAGGMAAAGVGALGAWAHTAVWLRPLWGLLHALAMVLGVWLCVTGRQPLWMAGLGRVRALKATSAIPGGEVTVRWGSAPAGRRWPPGLGASLAAGSLWVAWPCGLLQSALLVASLGNSPAVGAAAMAGFALISSLPLQLAPWIWDRVGAEWQSRFQTVAVRLAGLLLTLGSGFALGKDVWHEVAAYCGF